MTRLILIIIVSLLFSNTTINTQWEQISTIGNNEIRGVVFVDEQTGVVCGNCGIWSTTKSGMNWTYVWNASNYPSGIYFIEMRTESSFTKTLKIILIK